MFLGHAALAFKIVDGDLDVVQGSVVVLELVVPLSQKHVGVGVRRLGHVEPFEQGIDAVPPALLHEIELSDRKARVDFHRQGNIGLLDHVLVGLQRRSVILARVVDEGVQVVDIGQLIAVQFVVPPTGQHGVENFYRRIHISGFGGGLGFSQLFVHLVAQSRGAARFLPGVVLLRVVLRLRRGKAAQPGHRRGLRKHKLCRQSQGGKKKGFALQGHHVGHLKRSLCAVNPSVLGRSGYCSNS